MSNHYWTFFQLKLVLLQPDSRLSFHIKKGIGIFSFLISFTPLILAHEVTLQIKVLYDGETVRPASHAVVYFSDGQSVSANSKGLLSRKFTFTDSTYLVKISKIAVDGVVLKLINHRRIHFILLDPSKRKVAINAYILDQDAWTSRKNKVEQVAKDQYDMMLAEYNSYPVAIHPLMQDVVNGFNRYRPFLISNITSTVHNELSDAGKNAFQLALESNNNLDRAISLIDQVATEKKETTEDLLLLSRLSTLAFSRMAEYYYQQAVSADSNQFGYLMEYKEMAITLGKSAPLEPFLKNVLVKVKDSEFQATNRNDLASIYQEQGHYELAIKEARLALDYYKTLESMEPDKFQLQTNAVMFNLASAYRALERNKDALDLYHEVLERISVIPEQTSELQSITFYANMFIAEIIQQEKGLKEAYPFYDKMFTQFKASPEIALTLPKDNLFDDYLDYCEGMELMNAPEEDVTRCYEESIQLLDNAFDSERKTLGRTLVYYKLANTLEEKGEFENALKFYQRALKELEQTETPKTRALSIELYNCIGEVLDAYGQDQEALEYFQNSLRLAQTPGYETDAATSRHLAETWYKIGQYYYKRADGDSASYSFNKTIEFLNHPRAHQDKNIPLLANAYNMKGATLAELLHDKKGGEEYFNLSVNLYSDLMAIDPKSYMLEYASSANNLLSMQAQHIESTDKNAALKLIDDVLRAFELHPVQSTRAEEIQANMDRFRLLFSGQLTLIQSNLMEVGDLRDQRQKIDGQSGKSDIQSRIVSKLNEAYQLVDPTMKAKLGSILAQETGNLSWYAIFDHKFDLAESSAREALAIDPNQIWVNTNLAHSLILVGKIAEGKSIYTQYKDVKHSDGRLMGAVFLSDIEELEKAGINHEAWEDVKKLLRN